MRGDVLAQPAAGLVQAGLGRAGSGGDLPGGLVGVVEAGDGVALPGGQAGDRAAQRAGRGSGTSSPAGSMSTAVTVTPAACSSRAAVSSRTPAITMSPAGRSSSTHSNLKSKPGSHSGTAR